MCSRRESRFWRTRASGRAGGKRLRLVIGTIPLGLAICSFGCSLSDSDSAAAEAQARRPVTFNRDIGPIVYARCTPCHRPNGSAPFSLLTYDDIRPRADIVLAAVERRRMPPWLPEPGYGRFAGDRRLTEQEIGLLRQWADEGLQEGPSSERPKLPQWSERWQLGTPDLVLELPAYQLPAEGRDLYRNFVVAAGVSQPRYVRAVELAPGDPKVVHHARMMVDQTESSRRLDERDPEPGYDGMHLMSNAQNPDGHFVGWTPGKQPHAGADSIAWRLDPGTDLVLQLHLRPAARPATVTARIGLYFANRVPSRRAVILTLGSETIDIPADDSSYVVEDHYVLPVDVYALGVYPHAHYLAQEMQGVAQLPDGTTQWLLRIMDWDFNWQDEYWFAEAVPLPKGARITMRYQFDNSSGNPQNPHSPPQRVRWGPNSTDEMADLLIQVLPARESDRATLLGDLAEHKRPLELARLARAYHNAGTEAMTAGAVREAIEDFRRALELKPDLARTHNNLANALMRIGEVAPAIERYRAALRFEPDYAEAHFNLANVLQSQGHVDEAIAHYRDAVRFDPDLTEGHYNLAVALEARGQPADAIAHYMVAVKQRPAFVSARFNLANALATQGDLDGAMRHYRLLLETQPEHADAQNNLGMALLMRDRGGEALAHFREAARQRPDWPVPLVNLARALATSPDPDVRNPTEAIGAAEEAARRTNRRDPIVLETLAVAYALARRFEDAAATVEEALPLAVSAGQGELVAHLRQRLALYRSENGSRR